MLWEHSLFLSVKRFIFISSGVEKDERFSVTVTANKSWICLQTLHFQSVIKNVYIYFVFNLYNLHQNFWVFLSAASGKKSSPGRF